METGEFMDVKQIGTPFKGASKEKYEKEIMKMNDYLYHYTSIEKLALILKNRTIRFNNLLNVDDPEEVETSDLGKAGRHCLVSCWTDSEEDVIPMWNMYTPNMKGVRIKLRKYPFKQYTYNEGEMHFTENIKSYIDYNGSYMASVCISAECPLLEKIEYTNNEKLLKPEIITKSESGIKASFQHIGRCKRKYWNFQQEYRYIIRTAPWGMEELESVKSQEEQIQIFNRLLDENNNQFCNEIYLELAGDAFRDMEILMAPRTTESEYIIVQALLDKYCPDCHTKIKKSRIRIR